MRCPKCYSENITFEVKRSTLPVIPGCMLMCFGFGLMMFGIAGAVIGLLIGLVLGLIAYACTSGRYDTICICKDCGNNWKAANK